MTLLSKRQQLPWPRNIWSTTSIQIKILVPLMLLLSLSLAGSAFGFILSTNATRDSMLDHQLDEDTHQITAALEYSQRNAVESARRLAQVLNGPLVLEYVADKNQAEQIYQQIVFVRERFDIDQIIVVNTEGKLRANIAPSHLESIHIRQPDLLYPCTHPEERLVQYQQLQLLVVCMPVLSHLEHITTDNRLGNVYTILDLQALLKRIRRNLELESQVDLLLASVPGSGSTGTSQDAGSSSNSSLHASRVRNVSVALGNGVTSFTLTLNSQAINSIVHSGVLVMLISSILSIIFSITTVALAIRIILISPLIQFTQIAEQVASGDLTARARVESHDEFGILATTFNHTTTQLQELVQRLEQRVMQRTAELTATNENLRQEIRERQRAEEQIRYQQLELQRLATTDELTNLYNRRYFFERGQQEIHRARSDGHFLTVLMLDIDYFKKINDTYGHSCGDQVLRVVAQRCRENLRDTDIVGRYGGEEFAILLPGTNTTMAFAIAERLRTDVAATPFQTEQGRIAVTVSIGIATANSDDADLDLEKLLDQADTALYKAKRCGRNRVEPQEQRYA